MFLSVMVQNKTFMYLFYSEKRKVTFIFCLLQEVVMAIMVILTVWLQVEVIGLLLLRKQAGLLVCISAMIMPLRMWRFWHTVIPSVVSKPLQATLFLCFEYVFFIFVL